MTAWGLEGKKVLISGAGGGIGRTLATQFRAAGADVWGADRSAEMLADFAPDRRLVFDLGRMAETRTSVTSWLAGHEPWDIVVANAGYSLAETLEKTDIEAWERELTVNLSGAYAMTAPIIEAMAARGTGSLVFISSVNGLAHYGNPAYAAAKAGLIAYARAIAVERGQQGIRANVVAPGSVRTPAWDKRIEAEPDLLSRVVPHYPIGRMVTPEEVANAALFLASPMASGITGATLTVDGGLTAGNFRFVDEVLRQH